MHNWFLRSPLFDAGPALGGGSDTTMIDPGAPHEVDPDEPEEKKPPAKSAEAVELETLRAETAALKKRADEAEEDSRYWSRRAQERRAESGRQQTEEEPRRRTAEPITEKPEKLIDELSTDGIAALKKRGIVTQEDLDAALTKARQDGQRDTEAVRSDAEFSMKLEREFPEILADSKLVSAGERPKTELFKRTREIYQEAVAEDPSLEASKGAMLMAARQAKRELDATGKGKGKGKEEVEPTNDREDRQQRRRERIDAQTPTRSRDDEESRGTPDFTREQLEVMKHLNVKPEAFAKHRDRLKGARNGR